MVTTRRPRSGSHDGSVDNFDIEQQQHDSTSPMHHRRRHEEECSNGSKNHDNNINRSDKNKPKRKKKMLKRKKKPNQYFLYWQYRIVIPIKKALSKGLYVQVCWMVTLLGLLGLVSIFLLGYTGLWTFRHLQCYSREAGVTWKEGPSHEMLRTCPPITQYTTRVDSEQQSHDDENDKSNPEHEPHICITTLTDEQSPSWWQRHLRCRDFDEVGKLTWPNRQRYAEKHGYTLLDASFLIDSSRPPAWSKIKAVQYLMSNNFTDNQQQNPSGKPCDWIFWMDADTVILNSTVKVESILPTESGDDEDMDKIDLVVTWDRRFTANSGAWLIRAQSDFSRAFLAEWWNMKHWVREPGLSLSGDNAAFGHVIDSNRDSATDFKIKMVPRCTFNSFGVYLKQHQLRDLALHPEQLPKQEWYNSPNFYHKGDFIGHASGIDQKEAGIRMLLRHAV